MFARIALDMLHAIVLVPSPNGCLRICVGSVWLYQSNVTKCLRICTCRKSNLLAPGMVESEQATTIEIVCTYTMDFRASFANPE